MKSTPIIVNNWNIQQGSPSGKEIPPKNQPGKSEDQDAKIPEKEEKYSDSITGKLFSNIYYGGIAIGLLTAVFLILRFIFKKEHKNHVYTHTEAGVKLALPLLIHTRLLLFHEYIRVMLIGLKYILYIAFSVITINLVAFPYVLPLATFIAKFFTDRKMARDNNKVEKSGAIRTVGALTCLVIDSIEGPDEPEVWKAIQKLQSAGITVRMVTEDDVNTARSIATKCGIIRPGDDFLVLEGLVFNQKIRDSTGDVKQELFDEVWPRLRVLAASTPNDKYLLVKHIMESKLNPKRKVVAVTGQGADDIPILKKADIGFALGIVGTVEAKEAADIVLTDDNISSIVKAVMWGRNAYESIAKFLQFQLSINLVAVIVEVVCDCAILRNPFTSVHFFWIYLFVCSLAAFGLCTEKPDPAILERKYYGRNKSILSGIIRRNIIGQAVYQTVVIFILLFAGGQLFQIKSGSIDVVLFPPYQTNQIVEDIPPTQHFTIIFNTFSLMTLFNGLNARLIHGQRNIFEGLFGNPIFCMTFIITALAQIVIVQFIGITDTVPLTYYQWMWCFIIGASVILWGQVLASNTIKRIPKLFFRDSQGQAPNRIICTSGGRLHRMIAD